MALQIDDAETESLVHQLAESKRVGPAEAVKLAVRNELRRLNLRERIKPVLDRMAAMPDSGLKADKAFFDELSED